MRFGILSAIVMLLIAPAQAYGARVGQMVGKGPDGAGIVWLEYWADPQADEVNQLSVRLDGSDYLFTDEGAQVQAGPHCSQEAENAARCDAQFGYYQVEVYTWLGDDRVEVGQLRDPLRVWVDKGNDFVVSENSTSGRSEHVPASDEIDGGPGDDRLLGGPGADLITGGRLGGYQCADPMTCGGRDTLDGRAGDDVIQDSDAVNGTPVDRDVLSGGPGRDTLDYSPRHAGSVRVSLDPATDHWADNEDDISGFEDLTGTVGSDDLTGDGAGNTLTGGLGPDLLFGRAGDDDVSGGSDFDLLEGGKGRDFLRGHTGDDLLRGGRGNDVLRGGDGRDRLHAHSGADLIRAADGNAERVYCGKGSDTVSADPRDRLIGCERIIRKRQA